MCLIMFSLDVGLGSVKIPPIDVLKVLAGIEKENELWNKIIFMIRLPKALSAVLAGSALAVAGLQMQTLFHNPLAGPSVLGYHTRTDKFIIFPWYSINWKKTS